jgi:hypothetical protein
MVKKTENVWREVDMPYYALKFAWSSWDKSRETSLRIVVVPPKIRTDYLQNKSVKHYHYTSLSSGIILLSV